MFILCVILAGYSSAFHWTLNTHYRIVSYRIIIIIIIIIGSKKKIIIIIITTSVSETIRKPPFVKAQTAFKNKNKIKYGEKRFLIWRMELLQPAMWQVALG